MERWAWRYRLTVRTEPSQGSNTGSIPVSATNSFNNLQLHLPRFPLVDCLTANDYRHSAHTLLTQFLLDRLGREKSMFLFRKIEVSGFAVFLFAAIIGSKADILSEEGV